MNFTTSKKRVLSVFSLVMINVIAIDSLRNLPLNAKTGLSIATFYVIGAILFLLPCVLITAELATNRPKTGGSYVWVREAFGTQWGFLNIWLQWIYNVIWYPTILSFIAANIAYLIDPHLVTDKSYMVMLVIAMFAFATIVNCFGMKMSSLISAIAALAGTIIPMLIIIGLGVGWVLLNKPVAITPQLSDFIPNITSSGNLAFLVVVLFSLMGLEMSAVHAEEVKNPKRDFPRALIYSALLIVVTMILASVAIAMIVPKSSLNIVSGLDQAFATFLSALDMKWALPIVVILIIVGGFGGMAAWVVGPTKGLMVAAEDGSLPKALGYKNRFGAPVAVLILQFIIVAALCGAFLLFKSISTWYWILSDLTAQLALLFYVVFFAAAIRLRYKTEKKADTFRIPGGNIGIWIVGLIGIFACVGGIAIGFVPPSGVQILRVGLYESILILGVVIFTCIPLLIYWFRRASK